MEVTRTIPIIVPNDSDVLATVRAFQIVTQATSYFVYLRLSGAVAAEWVDEWVAEGVDDGAIGDLEGTDPPARAGTWRHPKGPPSAITLHHALYADVKGFVSAQMTATAIRLVAGAYKSAWRKGHALRSHFAFRRPLALWLIGDRRRGRDASLPEEGLLSLWTVAGRKRLPYTVPAHFQALLDRAVRINSVTITAEPAAVDGAYALGDAGGPEEPGDWSGGPLRAWLTVTVSVPEPVGRSPVGIDRGAINSLVAVDEQDRVLFVSGAQHQARNERTRQVRERVLQKLATRQAQGKDTRSLRRVKARLSRKQRNRTRTFAQQTAMDLCRWAPPEAVFVLEDLRLPAAPPVRRAQREGRLTGWFHGVLRQCLENKAQERGVPVHRVSPAFTSRVCSRCGALGRRRRQEFRCLTCGHTDHADVNAARNIRNAGGP